MARKIEYKKSAKEIELEKKVSIPMIFDKFIVPEIPDYYSLYPVNFDAKPVACCPLHDEDTPSMRYYEETNSFYCFGCGRGGSVVTLFRLFYNRMRDASISRQEAVDFLYKYFIEGRELANLPSANKVEQSKNKPVDVIRFNKYRIDTEELITFDKSISNEAKKKLWQLFDTVDMLLEKDLIDVNDAMDFCKKQTTEIIKGGAVAV